MSRPALVLRPEPGNAATAARLETLGVTVQRIPLFAVRALEWIAPDPARFDALLLTSANAVRHAGPGLTRLAALPVLAVGAATAAAARAAGLAVTLNGATNAADIVQAAYLRGWCHLLHLSGRHRTALPGVEAIAVYASDEQPVDEGVVEGWAGTVALLHSPRAARRFADLAAAPALRATIAVAALSEAVADAAGRGWTASVTASVPTDAALVTCARELIDRAEPASDKQRA